MKKTILGIQSLANRWFQSQFKTPIDSDYISKNIIYKYAYTEYLKDKEVPFYIFANKAYHYYKLGKINKVEEMYIAFINKANEVQPNRFAKNIVIKPSANPKGFERPIDISKGKKEHKVEIFKKFNSKDTEFKLLKNFFILAISIDKLITNNKLKEQKEEYSNYLNKCKTELEKKLNKKVALEALQRNIELIGNNEKVNTFNTKANLNDLIQFFSVFKGKNKKNGDKQWLSDIQFNKFIERAFQGNTRVEKQKFEMGMREKYFIVKRFVELYESHLKLSIASKSDKINYIKLLTDNFTGWSYEKVSENFKTTCSKRSWNYY